MASLGPKSVEMTAELADGWLPAIYVPERAAAVWGEALRSGTAPPGRWVRFAIASGVLPRLARRGKSQSAAWGERADQAAVFRPPEGTPWLLDEHVLSEIGCRPLDETLGERTQAASRPVREH